MGDLLILGNQAGKFLQYFGQPAPQLAQVFAVNKHTGAAVWHTQIDSTPLSFVTNSAIVHDGVAYVGTASNEERVAAFVPNVYWQWQFRGATVALDVPGFYVPPNNNCPTPSGPDYDFAQGPMLIGSNGGDNEGGNLVGAGQKSGMFWAFNAKTGKLAWSRQVAPGGDTGGLQWGSSIDGRTIWAAAANAGDTLSGGVPKAWTLKDGTTTTAGGWAAINAQNGNLLWTKADPLGGRSESAVTSANGVIFGCSKAPPSTMFAMNAATGAVLWSYSSGGFCNAGASVAVGMVYWGSGTFQGTGVKKVFAFGL